MNARFFLPIGIFLALVAVSAVSMMSMLNGDQAREQLPSPLIGKDAPELILVPFDTTSSTSQRQVDLKQLIGNGPFAVNFFCKLVRTLPKRGSLPG